MIRGTAVNQDGRSNGLTAPNGPAQEAVIRAGARANAGVDPARSTTSRRTAPARALGDPIELAGARRAVLGAPADGRPCLVGSVKTNIGHLEAAAGIAGLIKVVLALRAARDPAATALSRSPTPRVRLKVRGSIVVPAGDDLAVSGEASAASPA